MNNKYINKAISLFTLVIMIFSSMPIGVNAALNNKSIQAAYGTPVIDGQIDDVWRNSNYTYIDRETNTGNPYYTGWLKLLWDNENIYVLGRIYTLGYDDSSNYLWKHDCLEVFFDEDNKKSTTADYDDYQLRANFAGLKSAKNYNPNDMTVATMLVEEGFMVEMAIPLQTIKPKKGMKLGFDAQVFRTGDLGNGDNRYGWNSILPDISNSPNVYGTLELTEKSNVVNEELPEYKRPTYGNVTVKAVQKTEEKVLINDVSVKFDGGNEKILSVLHVNEYPCLEINELAGVIGATVINGNTISKDGINVTYTAGERLAQDNGGNFILECEATSYQGKLYVPVTSLEVTYIYNTEYNRFEKILDIIPKHSPKDAEVIIKVEDYGAVGDGVHDDKDAVLAAFYAATTAGVPARLEFERGKTYFLSEVMDSMYMFQMLGVEDFVFAGNGATLLFDAPMGNLFTIGKSARVRIENLTIDTVTPVMTQGKVVGVNAEDGYMDVVYDDGYSTLPPIGWITANNTEYAVGQIIHATEAHPKFISANHFWFDDVTLNDDGTYRIKFSSSSAKLLSEIAADDRYVIMRDVKNYDLSHEAKQKWTDGGIGILNSGDIEIKNVSMYGNIHLAAIGNYNWGNITFDNFNILNHDGEIYSSTRDIIHFTHNRGGMLIQNCTFNGAGDDYFNTKSSPAVFKSKISDRTYQFDAPVGSRVGDEVWVFDVVTHEVLSRAFIKNIQWITDNTTLNQEKMIVTLDRDIEGIKTADNLGKGEKATVIYNLDVATDGTVVRNNVFTSGRRHVWINRAPNCIFENNYTKDMGGSMIDGSNEIGNNNEGPLPSSFTIRNNEYYCSGNAFPATYPLRIRSSGSINGQTAAIDGVLIENNYFEIPRVEGVIKIADTVDLYMLNNTIKSTVETTDKTMPVQISNSKIKLIDGLTSDYTNDVKAVVNIGWTEYEKNNLKNIKSVGTGKATPVCDYSGE